MRRSILSIFAVTLAFGLVGCGKPHAGLSGEVIEREWKRTTSLWRESCDTSRDSSGRETTDCSSSQVDSKTEISTGTEPPVWPSYNLGFWSNDTEKHEETRTVKVRFASPNPADGKGEFLESSGEVSTSVYQAANVGSSVTFTWTEGGINSGLSEIRS
jgi:hypothetical protein